MRPQRWLPRWTCRSPPLPRAVLLLWSAADRTARQRISVALAFVFAFALLTALSPVLFKLAVDRLEPGVKDAFPIGLVLLLVAYGAIQWLAKAFAELRTYAHITGEQRILRRLSRHLFAHVLALPIRFHLERRTGAVVQTLNNGILGCRLILQHALFSVLPACIELPIMAAVLVHFGQSTFLAVLAASAIAYNAAFTIGVRRMSAPAHVASAAGIHASALMTDGLLNIETIKAFNGASGVEARYDVAFREGERAWCWLYRRKAVNGLLVATIMAISLTISLVLATHEIAAGRMSVGDFVLVNAYVLQIVRPLETLGFALRDIAQGLAFVDRMIGLLQEEAESTLPTPLRPIPDSLGDLIFDRVSFSYPRGRPALRQASFRIPAKSMVALVGASGAGKSTVVRLLLRFFEPDEGRILMGSVPLCELAAPELRRRIALVPQETILFNDTIAANIAFGRPQATRVEIENAARAAGLHSFIESLPQGYDTAVGERGVKLSGGERQRIAFARAALVRPEIWILDEATSALDARTEREILRTLAIAAHGTTCLIISHRLSAARQADAILVFSHGTVVEYGRHADLLARNGVYTALWRAQCGKILKPTLA